MTTAPQNRTIHGLKKQITGFDDTAYRCLLQKRFRVVSSKDLSARQADDLIDALKSLSGQTGGRRPSNTASGRYAPVLQALWIAAWNLGVVSSRDDQAMLAFVARQTGLSHSRFLTDHSDAIRAIEALKSWIARESGIVWPKENDKIARKWAVIEAQERLLRATGDADFSVEKFGALEGLSANLSRYTSAQFDILAAKIGVRLRARKNDVKGGM